MAGLPEALPGADREAEAIEDAWKGRSVILLRGEQATEAAVRTAIPMGDIVQFSCHSIVQKVFSFSDGAILLGSGDEIHDGILTSKELAALDWRADLVILASCRSLDGEMIEGEGTLSLARSLLVGGVSHVVASLWPVGDEATARLMAGLHRGLAAGRGPVEALAIAQAEELMLRGSSDFDPTVMGFMVIGR